MEELCVEGLANHDDREPCAGAREGAGEASVAARAGRAIEPRNVGTRGADAVGRAEGNTLTALSRAAWGPRAVRDPWHVRNLRAREPGGPVPARPRGLRAGRRGTLRR